jgi:DNA-binding beta-propeller fold protein YncE
MKTSTFVKIFLFIIILYSGLITTDKLLSQASKYKITGVIDIGGEAKWDYLSIEYTMHRLYVSHGSSVNVINLKDDSIAGEIQGLHGVHGIAFAPEFGKGFISEGASNSVTVFDLKTLKVLKVIQLPDKKPDAIIYDPFTKRIFTFNGGSDNATAIDLMKDTIAGTVSLGGSPEFAVSDEQGNIFVNIEDKSEIVQFSSKTLTVISRSSLAPAATPTGMAFDKRNKRIFVGGRNKLMAVVDAVSGKVIQTLPIGNGVDACAFDPRANLVFCSNKDGTITVIKQESPDKYSVIDNAVTQEGARTMALDLITHNIYTSTMIKMPVNKESDNPQKSFGVLILDNK